MTTTKLTIPATGATFRTATTRRFVLATTDGLGRALILKRSDSLDTLRTARRRKTGITGAHSGFPIFDTVTGAVVS